MTSTLESVSLLKSHMANGVVRLPVGHTLRAYTLLAAQPVTLAYLDQSARNRVVVSAVVDEKGIEHVVSRVGDNIWDLTSLRTTQNNQKSTWYIKWPTDLPQELVDDAKAAVYVWLKQGRGNSKKPSGSTLRTTAHAGIITLRYLASKGVRCFKDVHPIYLSDLVSELKKTLEPNTIRARLSLIDVAWDLNSDLLYPLTAHPWSGKNLGFLCGVDDRDEEHSGRRGKTPVIPPSIQRTLFNYAEACVNEAAAVFAACQKGLHSPEGQRAKRVRNAVLYLVQITSGMRNSEAIAIKSNNWRVEVRNGVTYHWVTTTESKTGKGVVDFLVPPETIGALEVLQKFAKPLQERLATEIVWLEQQLMTMGEDPQAITSNGLNRIEILQRLNVARASIDNLFLGHSQYYADGSGKRSRVDVMTNLSSRYALIQLSKDAGVNWKINNHQCRRTFAWTVANCRLGRSALIFVKWQLKHSSISMSQLYAANPRQDASLYEELYEELISAQTEVLESWFDHDHSLSGGGGRKIMQTRAIAIKDRKSMLRHTAEHVTIRSTGHSWCLAEESGCVGEGIYEAIRCGSCSAAVIDASHVGIWQNIHLGNLQLAMVVDSGPAVRKRAAREIATSEAILKELGVPLPL